MFFRNQAQTTSTLTRGFTTPSGEHEKMASGRRPDALTGPGSSEARMTLHRLWLMLSQGLATGAPLLAPPVLLFGLLGACSVSAQELRDLTNLRDPTTPLGATLEVASEPQVPEFMLTAIFMNAGKRRAIINGQRRRLRQSIEGFILTEIGQRHAELRRGETVIRVMLSRKVRQ